MDVGREKPGSPQGIVRQMGCIGGPLDGETRPYGRGIEGPPGYVVRIFTGQMGLRGWRYVHEDLL